ncbi:MAG: nitroreductase family protein [Geobacteraceae bacterium]|nr:nitroreductase family protein [Geobacteraceae bacterium]
MSLVTIDHTTCRRDGMCSAVCPMGLFDRDGEGFPVFRYSADQRCIACGHCVAVCPHGAVLHTALPLEDAPLVDHNLTVSVPALTQLLKNRRSVREFREEPVPEALVRAAIDTARWAPTAVNRQALHWLVIQTPSETRRLAGLIIDYLRRISTVEPRYAPVVAQWEQGKDPVLRNAPHMIIIHAPDDWIWSSVDSTIALTQFELAAVANGIGTCWAGYFMRAANGHPALREALGIPGDHSVFGALMYGFPRYRYHRIPPRQAARIELR